MVPVGETAWPLRKVLVLASAGGHRVHNDQGHCRFDIAAPRHFLYPALLLLLAEEPRHGYRLVDSLLRLGFGPVDRPSIYRALGDLEADGLLHSWEASPTAGSTRQIYGVTQEGHRRLSDWVGVVTAERSALESFLKRYDNLGDDSLEVLDAD